MKIKQAVELLREYNKWRRGSTKIKQPNPKEIGEAIDVVLVLADRLMSEPSETMLRKGFASWNDLTKADYVSSVLGNSFKAMRDQMIKELEDE